jgi:hypothetical protein
MAATSEKWRTEVAAKSLGHRLMRHAATNQHGRYYVSTLTSLDGGGATAQGDGTDYGGRSNMTAHNIEWVELNFPLLHLFNRHIKDAAGAGKYRGGAGVEYGFILHDAPDNRVKGVALGVAGLRNSGQGMFGGYPGAPSLLLLQENTQVPELIAGHQMPMTIQELGGEGRQLPYCDFEVTPGDVVIMIAASGGGYGDPLERDPALVLEDVQRGLVSTEAASHLYGVAILNDAVDAAATELARSRLREERSEGLAVNRPPDAGPRGVLGRVAGRHDVHPFRENLEIRTEAGASWVHCGRCGTGLCRTEDDWTAVVARTQQDPTRVGPLMTPLVGTYVAEQLCCPSCGALLSTDIVEQPAP